MPLLELRNISKHFSIRKDGLFKKTEIKKAVDNISLSIEAGEIIGLVGESGSGKSTTAKMLVKLLDPTSGYILYQGSDIKKLAKDYKKEVQIVFQNPYLSLNPRQNIFSCLKEGLDIHKPKLSAEQKKQIIHQALEDVLLPVEELYKFPHELSGGQRQRIAIARVLCIEPQLLVLDEPVSALDVSVQAQILNLLKSIQKKRNITYLLIAHDLHLVRLFCDRIYVMQNGKIVEEGKTEHIFEKPEHPYTKELLESVFSIP